MFSLPKKKGILEEISFKGKNQRSDRPTNKQDATVIDRWRFSECILIDSFKWQNKRGVDQSFGLHFSYDPK